jgi:hypothetical protein
MPFLKFLTTIAAVSTERRMDESQPDWLQEPVITEDSDLAENVTSIRCPPNSAISSGAAALTFICQAAKLIEGFDRCVAEKQARVEAAEALVKKAIEKLKIADAYIRSAESEALEANVALREFKDRMEAQLSTLEERTRNAEMRANEAERRFEDAIRVQVMSEKKLADSGRMAA